MVDDPNQPTPELPGIQECRKCRATFRWEPSNPNVKASPLVARLATPSDDCDCGYGQIGPADSTDP